MRALLPGGPIDLTLNFVFRPVLRFFFFTGLLAQQKPEIRLESFPVFLRIAERSEKSCLMTTNEMRWGQEIVLELFLRYDGSFYVRKDHLRCQDAPSEKGMWRLSP